MFFSIYNSYIDEKINKFALELVYFRFIYLWWEREREGKKRRGKTKKKGKKVPIVGTSSFLSLKLLSFTSMQWNLIYIASSSSSHCIVCKLITWNKLETISFDIYIIRKWLFIWKCSSSFSFSFSSSCSRRSS